MEPQDQAQITFRSEIQYIVFSVGQEGICLEDRISRLLILAQYTVCPKKISFSCIEF